MRKSGGLVAVDVKAERMNTEVLVVQADGMNTEVLVVQADRTNTEVLVVWAVCDAKACEASSSMRTPQGQ